MELQKRLIRPTSYVLFFALTCLVFFRPNTFVVVRELDDAFNLHQAQEHIGEDPIFLPRMGFAIGSFVAPGMGIAITPAVFVSKFIADWRQEDRTEWAWAAMAIMGYLVWCLCFPLTVKLLETFPGFAQFTPRTRFLSGLAIFLNLPLVSNAMGHPGSSHLYETAWALLMAIFLRQKRLLPATLACAAMTLTRFNDAPAFLMIAGAWIDQGRPVPRARLARAAALLAIVSAVLAAWHAAMIAFVRGYGVQTMQSHFANISWLYVKYFFTHWGHGVIYTYCLWFVAFVIGLWSFNKLSWAARGGWLWMLAHVFLYSFWGGPGASMGHRYLCGTMAGALLILGETFLLAWGRWRALAFAWFSAITGAWLTYLMITFCTVIQLNYSVDFGMKDQPGVIFHPYYFDRLRGVMGEPLLYSHLAELGLVGSLLVTKYDPDFGYHGEAVLPPGVPRIAGAWTFVLASLAALGALSAIFWRKFCGR